jgi:hypothetical protein
MYLRTADMQSAAVLPWVFLLLLLLLPLQLRPVPGVTEDPMYGDDRRVVAEVKEQYM